MSHKIFGLILGLMFASSAPAQGISPVVQILHANKKGEVQGSYMVKNATLHPIVARVHAQAFSVSDDGEVSMLPLDATTRVVLSASSINIPPMSDSSVDFKVSCAASCELAFVTNFANAEKVESGVGLQIVLPETVYVEREPIRKSDVKLSWVDSKTLLVENTGGGFDRPEVDAKRGGKVSPQPSFPLMGHSKRYLKLDAPAEVVMRFEHFTVKTAAP